MKFPYMDSPVGSLKAWQLYIGMSVFAFIIGLLLWLVTKMLNNLGLGKTWVGAIDLAGDVVGAQDFEPKA